MYKVLIADDEVLVRIGLKSTIDWESLGFTVVAEASNGEQAFEAYQLHKPDVIMTDIKMPKQDGLWLIKKIRQEDLQAKILILTCYDDFSYAREALKSGADDYILKSEVEDEELMKAMSAVRKSLDAEMSEQDRNTDLKKQMDTNIETLRGKLLEDLLKSTGKQDDTLASRCKGLGFALDESRFAFLAFFRDDAQRKPEFSEQEWQNMNNAILNMASGILSDSKMSCLVRERKSEFLFLLSKGNLGAGELQNVMEAIRTSIAQYFDIPLSAAISRTFDDIGDVSHVCTELHLKAEQLFYMNESSVVNASERDLHKVNIFSIKKSYEQLLIQHMDQEEEEKALAAAGQVETFFRQNTVKELEVKLFYSNMISNIFERYQHCLDKGDETGEYTYYHNRVMAITKIKGIDKLFKEVILQVIKNIKDYRLHHSNNIINRALDYIEKNYMKEISLRSLAAYLNLSKHYVCYLFKKETGDNITLYVNKLRIEKAKQLVTETDCKIKEIYDRLGFSDQQYFCKIFKKITGMTVMQYRDSVLKQQSE
jgi:two-component system, response regulator YesN